LTLQGMAWAFTTYHDQYWHPLSWLSHMVDCQIFGLNAGGHLSVNVLIHLSNSLLLFLFLKRVTGASWRSAIVAALFALHPLSVESAAWAIERKNTLSTFFGLLSLLAYARYAEAPSWRRCLLVALWLDVETDTGDVALRLPLTRLLAAPASRVATRGWNRAIRKSLGAADSRKTAALLPGRGFAGCGLPGALICGTSSIG